MALSVEVSGRVGNGQQPGQRRTRIALLVAVALFTAICLAYAAYMLDHAMRSPDMFVGRVVDKKSTADTISFWRKDAKVPGSSLVEIPGLRFWVSGALPIGMRMNVELVRGRITDWTYVESATPDPDGDFRESLQQLEELRKEHERFLNSPVVKWIAQTKAKSK